MKYCAICGMLWYVGAFAKLVECLFFEKLPGVVSWFATDACACLYAVLFLQALTPVSICGSFYKWLSFSPWWSIARKSQLRAIARGYVKCASVFPTASRGACAFSLICAE